jgi:exopolysaccharide biosynthesis polyprenyl glycosylphosphotransferase
MLKDRREGLVYLHWCALTIAAVGTYLGWVAFVRAWPSVHSVEGPNFLLYLLGVVVASFSVHIGGDDSSPRLGQMGLIESIPHTLHQLSRYIAVLLALAFITRDGDLSRKFLLGYIVNMSVVLTLANMYVPPIIAWFFFRENLMRTLLVADAGEIRKLEEMMAAREHLGITIVGWVGEGEMGEDQAPLPKLGELEQLGKILPKHNVSQVVISQHSFSPEGGRLIAQSAEEAGCRVRFFLHVQRYFPEQPVSIEQEGAFTLMAAASEPLENPLNRLLKRSLDIAISLPIVLFVLPPLSLVVWAVQRRQSPGPLLHRQYRSGLDHRKFLIFKFRTMHEVKNAAELSRQAQLNDCRIFPFGRLLRRTSLDEFPQFLNVLLGNMSVSGPRPHLIEHDEQFARIVRTYYTRQFVKPGITGLAQCNGFRGEISEPAMLQKRIGYDMLYIRRWTFALDLQILFQTVRQVVFPPGTAY